MTTAPAKKEKPAAGTLQATTRAGHGKGAARALRREGKVPGIIYGKSGAPVSIALTLKDVAMEYARGRFRSRLIDIAVDGKAVKALPKDVQFHPVTDVIEHVDFMKIEPGVPVHVMVPVKMTGQDKSPGLKRGGVLNVVRHEIEFICAPEAIPMHIEVDVAGLEIGGSVHINNITLPAGVMPAIKRNFTVATVAGRKAEEEEVKPVVAAAEGAAAAPGAEGAAATGAPGAAPAAAPAASAAPAAGGKDAGKKEGKK
ncbi:MAG: 50S ribosomal protein L25/general stress protein Ctc [Pseudomonadota bacterium]|nr:50S ribosomal protein L25/general stress protein Ctc [Pseudomonadota bacterium]MDE3037685.1 50S ribosomal protein L25/general stress protein Ctc [Pseudomonadota bacterium]